MYLPDILLQKSSVVSVAPVTAETSTLCVQDEQQSTEIQLYIVKERPVNGSRYCWLCVWQQGSTGKLPTSVCT